MIESETTLYFYSSEIPEIKFDSVTDASNFEACLTEYINNYVSRAEFKKIISGYPSTESILYHAETDVIPWKGEMTYKLIELLENAIVPDNPYVPLLKYLLDKI